MLTYFYIFTFNLHVLTPFKYADTVPVLTLPIFLGIELHVPTLLRYSGIQLYVLTLQGHS